MELVLAFLAAAAADPVKDVVSGFLVSYADLAAGVTFLISGLKTLWKDWVVNKEPVLAITLSYLLGIAAKTATDFYGEHTFKAWTIHLVILAFVAVGAAAFHDSFVNAITGKKSPSTTPPPGGGTERRG